VGDWAVSAADALVLRSVRQTTDSSSRRETQGQSKALVEALQRVGLGWPPDRSPFPGLRPFDADRRRVFFGRTEEVRQLAELLRSSAEHAEARCCWWWAPPGVASPRWSAPGAAGAGQRARLADAAADPAGRRPRDGADPRTGRRSPAAHAGLDCRARPSRGRARRHRMARPRPPTSPALERRPTPAAVTDTGAHFGAEPAPTDAPSKHGPSLWVSRRPRVLITDRVDLSPTARDFLRTSIRRDRHLRRRTITVLSVLLIFALVAAGVAVVPQRKAEDRRLVATARQLVAQAELARDTDPRIAMQLAIAANHIHPDGETHASLVNSLTTTRYISTLTGDTDDVKSFAFFPTRHLLVTAGIDQTVILWDLANPIQPRRLGQPLSIQGTWYPFVAFSPDGAILATGSKDGAVILWDLANLAQPQPRGESLTGHTSEVRSGEFSADGRILVTASLGGDIILWDLTDPTQPRRLGQTPVGGVNSVMFAPDGPGTHRPGRRGFRMVVRSYSS
jgi:WD domain, G-beta repeat